eukprot:2113239-Alexandrium_andersonii.AAC.1
MQTHAEAYVDPLRETAVPSYKYCSLLMRAEQHQAEPSQAMPRPRSTSRPLLRPRRRPGPRPRPRPLLRPRPGPGLRPRPLSLIHI